MPVEERVRLMVAAMERRQRALIMGVPKAALLLKAIAPGVVDRIVARVIEGSAR